MSGSATNDFQTFAGDPAADVLTQSDYIAAGFTPRVLGFSSGTAISTQLNKVWRQASLISHMIGQFTVDQVNQPMLDDGTPAGLTALESHFTAAIVHVAQGAIGTGYLPLVGGSLSGPLIINSASALQINAPPTQPAVVALSRQAGFLGAITAYTLTSSRWQLQFPTVDPEQGSNTGSNLAIQSFNDQGQPLDTPLSINRATGVVNFTHTPTLNGTSLPYVRLIGDAMSGQLGVGGQGIYYPGLGGNYNAHRTGFGWDGSFVVASVDGTQIGELATVGWANTLVGNYLPLAGGALTGPLTVHSNVVIDSTLYCRSTVYFSNLGDFANFYDGRYRYRQWASSWYDYWDNNTGTRGWICNGPSMSLDFQANLTTSGAYRANGGRIISINGGFAPSIGCYWTGGVAKGMWVDGSGLWLGQMDGNANPTAAHMLIDNNGYTTVYGNGQANGNWWVGGQLTTNYNLYVVGSSTLVGWVHVGGSNMQIDSSLNVNGSVSMGGQMTAGTIVANGNSTVAGTQWVNQNLSVAGTTYSGGLNVGNADVGGYLHANGSRFMCIAGGAAATVGSWAQGLSWAGGFWVNNESGYPHLNFGGLDGSGNPTGNYMLLSGNGMYVFVQFVAPSGKALKRNIAPAATFDSLAAIAATPISSFDYISGGQHVHHGIVAEDLRETIPDAVIENPAMTGVDPMALIAHLFRAVKQLQEQINVR